MNQFFFKINLNKFGELQKQKEEEQKQFISACITAFVVILIASALLFVRVNLLEKKIHSRKKLSAKIKKEIQQYKASGEYLSTDDLERLAKTSNERIFWAKKLVALSEQTNDKIAITRFAFKNGILSLYGITEIRKDQKEFDLINGFIQDLMKNEQINSDFPEIIFVKSSRDKEKDTDIMRFQIDCVSPKSGKRVRG
ncbi:MAG: hypothetical protein CSB55_04000 [Candidatus Cloacimonadota bacterium]|nr:MAG: hypothetical protein CSB55_04000 [Candidatus Cloacimonadota bacterium]